MGKRRAVLERLSTRTRQIGIVFPTRESILDPKTRAEVVVLLGRLLLEAARRESESEVRDDAS